MIPLRFPLLIVFALHTSLPAGTLQGYVRDRNWFAQYQSNPFGVGYYEFAVNANGSNLVSQVGGADDTDIFGFFQMANLPAGTYTVASWDVWWRSAFAFNVPVPAIGTAPVIDLRLSATMWGYPVFWEEQGYYEFGQTLVASGPISMIYLRAPHNTTYTLTMHEGGPGGPQIGQSRTFGANDQRPIYGYGQMPTVAGRTYYARIRTSSTSIGGVIRQMDPRPDYSDPMPGGCLYLGNGSRLTAYPDRDLGLVIMADDDGLLTNLHVKKGGSNLSATRLGQTFIARGVNLVSVALWVADSAPVYAVRILHTGPGGESVGTRKVGRIARGGDPEVIFTWSPGECPLVPGELYYVELTRNDGLTINLALCEGGNPYAFGEAFQNDTPLAAIDLSGTIMEEADAGSATQPTVRITTDPSITEPERGIHTLTLRWTTDVASDSQVEYAPENPPYIFQTIDKTLTQSHVVTLSNLAAHTLYHFRVVSQAAGWRPAVSRDIVVGTQTDQTNLLVNPGFEQGSGGSPRKPVIGWNTFGLDIAASDGTWFWGLKPHTGQWLLEGAINGSTSDGGIYQRVLVSNGEKYTASAWVITGMRENDTWKYDVWNDPGRIIYMQLGIDPTGGTSINSASVQWTPRMYSHRHYTYLAKTVKALSSYVTVFLRMKGQGGQWHLFGVDDCVLAKASVLPPQLVSPVWTPETGFTATLIGVPGRTTQILRSEDLQSWSSLLLITNLAGRYTWTDSNALQLPARFYRAGDL